MSKMSSTVDIRHMSQFSGIQITCLRHSMLLILHRILKNKLRERRRSRAPSKSQSRRWPPIKARLFQSIKRLLRQRVSPTIRRSSKLKLSSKSLVNHLMLPSICYPTLTMVSRHVKRMLVVVLFRKSPLNPSLFLLLNIKVFRLIRVSLALTL